MFQKYFSLPGAALTDAFVITIAAKVDTRQQTTRTVSSSAAIPTVGSTSVRATVATLCTILTLRVVAGHGDCGE